MNDLLRNFADGAEVRVEQDIGLFVERLARGQHLADFGLRIFPVQQWTMVLVPHPLPDFIWRGPKADHERVLLEAGQIRGIHRKSPAGGDDRSGACRELLDDVLFERAKHRFAVAVENVRDGPARPGLDQLIRVKVVKAQLLGNKAAHGGLACAHEPDERDVGEAAVTLHGFMITQACRRRNSIRSCNARVSFRRWTSSGRKSSIGM